MSRCIHTLGAVKYCYSCAFALTNWTISRKAASPYLLFVTQWHVSYGEGRRKAHALIFLTPSSSEGDQLASFLFQTSIVIGMF